MGTQWVLMVASLVSGVGGWAFAAACAHLLAAGRGVRVRVCSPHLVACALAACGCVAAVVVEGVSLGSASALFQLLSRPGSSLFAFMASLVCLVVACVVLVAAASRGAGSRALRVLAALGAACGLAVAACGGAAFLPSSYAAWNTPLLPVAVALTEAAGGCGAYALACCALAAPEAPAPASGSGAPAAPRPLRVRLAAPWACALAGCALAAAGACAYVGVTGLAAAGSAAWGVGALVCALGSLACAAAGFALRGRRRAGLVLAALACVLGLACALCLRMYLGAFAVKRFNLVSSPLGRL